jgi:hypothetical protein
MSGNAVHRAPIAKYTAALTAVSVNRNASEFDRAKDNRFQSKPSAQSNVFLFDINDKSGVIRNETLRYSHWTGIIR